MFSKTQTLSNAFKAIAFAAITALPLTSAAQPYHYDYRNEIDPAAQQPAVPLDQDRQDLVNARHRADDLATQRDQQQHLVDSMMHPDGPAAGSIAITPTGDVKTLQQQFNDAKAKADKIHADLVARFEAGDAWKGQFAKFDQARRDLKGPTDEVLNRISQTPEFKELVATARAAKEKADKLHEDKSADPKTVKEADDAFMAADNRVQEAAEHALQADPKVIADRKVVDEAQARLHDLRDKFEQDLINDPTFGPAVQEVQARQQALDVATGHATPPQNAVTPSGDDLRNAQAKLDQLNHDLDQARADVDQLTDRVRQDEDAMASANAPAPAPVDVAAVVQPAYSDYGYAPYSYGPSVVPVYSPAYAYDSDWWSPGLYFGLSLGYGYHDGGYGDWYHRWCGPSSAYYGGYYGRSGYGSYNRYGYGYAASARGYYSSPARSSYYNGRSYDSSYQARVTRRYDYALADHAAYEARDLRRDQYAAADYSAYRQRVERRATESQSTRSSYEARVPRTADIASPRSYEPRTESRSVAPSRSYSGESRSTGRETPSFSRSSSSESHESHSSSSSSHDHGGSSESSSSSSRGHSR